MAHNNNAAPASVNSLVCSCKKLTCRHLDCKRSTSGCDHLLKNVSQPADLATAKALSCSEHLGAGGVLALSNRSSRKARTTRNDRKLES